MSDTNNPKAASTMREGFEQQRKAGMQVDWFTWQIAWHDALFTVHDIVPAHAEAVAPQQNDESPNLGDLVERLALKHIAPNAKAMFPDRDYRETESFRRVLAYTEDMLAADEWEIAGFKKYAKLELGKRKLVLRVCAPATDAAPPTSLTITLRQAERLLAFFGGHDCEITVSKDGDGLLARCTEYPEEGAENLGPTEVDDELAANGRAALAQDAAVGEREARAVRLLEIAEPILEAAALNKAVPIAAGGLLRQVRVFLPVESPLPRASDAQQEPGATCLGWRVRERRDSAGALLDCFVEAPVEGDMPYALEVLGDDYTGYGGIERKLEHCKLIVARVNAAPQAADSADAQRTDAEGLTTAGAGELTIPEIKEVWKRTHGEELENTEFGSMVIEFAHALLEAAQGNGSTE